MAIIRKELGNRRDIIVREFRKVSEHDGLAGLAFSMFCKGWRAAFRLQAERITELDMLRAGVRVSLIACRAAVQKGGEVTEEILTELIDELKGGD